MNFNLASIVLFVALCWMSVGIYATNDTTTMAPGNGTTGSSNMTTGNTTTGSSNMTTGNATTGSSNMTTGNATTGPPNTNTGNATTGSSNMTTGNATTGSSNATTGNATTGSSNATTGNNTSVTNATASPPTTTAPPIVPNATAEELTTIISRGQCREDKLCAAHPNNCDPEVAGSCFFVGVKRSSGQNMDFELSGETDGYLGCTLKPTGGNETAYLCVKTKNKVIFIGAKLVNGKFTNETLRVNKVKTRMNGRKVQCSFSATVPNATARGSDTTFALSVVTGTYNEIDGVLGTPETQIRTAPVDLTSPTADTNNTVTNSTAAPATTTAGTVPLQSISTALLIILGVLSLAWL